MEPALGRAALADEDRRMAAWRPCAEWEPVADCDWELCTERGPNWLFVRIIRCPDRLSHDGELAERIIDLLDQHTVNRVVLELDGAVLPCERLVVELQQLDAWMQEHEGVLRLCGLPTYYVRRMRRTYLAIRFPVYRSRAEAVWGGTRCDLPPR